MGMYLMQRKEDLQGSVAQADREADSLLVRFLMANGSTEHTVEFRLLL